MACPSARGWILALIALCSSACSVILDTEKKQCSTDMDCAQPYVCGGGGLCAKKACGSDADCSARNGICEQPFCEPKQCKDSAGCEADERCDDSGRCVAADCRGDDDCGPSPTATCSDGICKDEIWGCAGQPDDRPEPTSDQATYAIKVYAVLGGGPVSDLKVKACTALSADCAQELAGVDIDIASDGTVTITKLPQDTFIHLFFEADGFYSAHFFTQRTARDTTKEPTDFGLLEAGFLPGVGDALGVEVDTVNNGTLFGRIVDCNNEWVEGVSIDITQPLQNTKIFYVENNLMPNPDLQSTTSQGAFGVANVRPNFAVTLRAKAGDALISSATVTTYPGMLTYYFFYPRDYAR